MVWLGTRYSTLLVLDARTWGVLILAYCFVASLTPVWALLQPRGYLGRLRPLHGARGGRGRHLLRRLPGPAGGLQDLARPGRHGRALPVPVRDHRLRRLLGLPRPRLLGHHLEADREGVALPARWATAAMLLEALRGPHRALDGDDRERRRARGQGARAPSTARARPLPGRAHRREATASSPPPSGPWRSRPSSSTPSTSRRASAATSCRSCSGGRAAPGASSPRSLTVAVPLVILLAAGEGAYRAFWVLFGTSNQLLAALSLLGISVWLRRARRKTRSRWCPWPSSWSSPCARSCSRPSGGRARASGRPACTSAPPP